MSASSRAAEVIVAGHICLDIIPKFLSNSELEPGKLVEVGEAELSTGGCVPNVGRALHRLGVGVRLVGRIGDDPFGSIVKSLIAAESPDLANELVVAQGGITSYSVVLNPIGVDRTFLHMPGENNHFSAGDLPDFANSPGAKIFHFGYPPLMAKMFEDEGSELEKVLRKAKESGVTVSLDMSLPDPASPSGRAPWRAILARILPFVDLFFPSEEELSFMLGTRDLDEMLEACLDFGAGVVVVKRGELGLAGSSRRLFGAQRLNQPCMPVQVVGTTGAGDATIAGFLSGVLKNATFEECLRVGCEVGAQCVQAADAVSGIHMP